MDWVFFWIILMALILKYPFYEFGPRYTAATGKSLLSGYKAQGKWAVLLYLAIIFINMFTVTGALAAVCAGLLTTMGGLDNISMPILVSGILCITILILLIGGYKILDNFIKLVSVVLLITVSIALVAVLIKGQVKPVENLYSTTLLKGTGLAFMISLIGWMPSGMEASVMHSIWVIEKTKNTQYRPTMKESLQDFNLGYIFTAVLALMFLVIGAFTVFGSGQLLDGNTTQFSNKLLNIFIVNLGTWSYLVIALTAFGTIYGTLITVMDAFTRSFIHGLILMNTEDSQIFKKQNFMDLFYKILLTLVGFFGFLLFYFSATSMIKILEYATTISFITAPIIAFLNIRSVKSKAVHTTDRPSKALMFLAYIGLLSMIIFCNLLSHK